MGIDLHCVDNSFGCSYGGWHTIRETIIKASLEYIIEKFKKDEELYTDITDEEDENYINEGSSYYFHKKIITNIISQISLPSVNTNISPYNSNILLQFLNLASQLSTIDSLIYFNIGGLYALCNKSDCEGFYSVGNAHDIVLLFDTIEPFFKQNYEKYNNHCYECVYITEGRFSDRLYDVFKESTEKNQKITIC